MRDETLAKTPQDCAQPGATGIVEWLHRLLLRLERMASLVASVMLFLIMTVVVVDVALRYVFNSPLGWSYDLISLYLMVGLFFFSLSATLQHNEHVRVDLLLKHFPRWARHLAEVVTYLSAGVVFALIVYVMGAKTLASFAANEVASGEIAWPTWLSLLAAPLGAGLMLLRMLLRVAGHVLSLATGRSVIALPPLTGFEEGA